MKELLFRKMTVAEIGNFFVKEKNSALEFLNWAMNCSKQLAAERVCLQVENLSDGAQSAAKVVVRQ